VKEQPFRNAAGGLIDRNQPLEFSWDGKVLPGFAGDTLASALLANGVHLVGRSFKYHRPRGIFGAGAEEPNALVTVGTGARAEPNLKATQVELHDGLIVESQNRWPNLRFDVGQVIGLVSRFIPAGFYYKTFMGLGFMKPGRSWMFYEPFIRRAAGLGKSAIEPDPDNYALRHAHCDVLVAGGGPAGLMAALEAARSGARVVLIEDAPKLGGRALMTRSRIGGQTGPEWVESCRAELSGFRDVRILTRTSAFGYFDHNLIGALERVTDHQPMPTPHAPRHRRWMIRARQVVLATGGLERPIAFGGNDRPGVMAASAAQTYANQYAVRCGNLAVLMTNNDAAYDVVHDLRAANVDVDVVIDVRPNGPGAPQRERLQAAGVDCLKGYGIVDTLGPGRVRGVRVARLDEGGRAIKGTIRRIDCDLVLSSGGWNPAVHLFSQSTAKVQFDDELATFVPGKPVQATWNAGGAAGEMTLAAGLAGGMRAGAEAASACGFSTSGTGTIPACYEESGEPLQPVWLIEPPQGWHNKSFVDFQNDVTTADVVLAARENYRSVEHLKRYTTLGMGTDQGRTSNVIGLAVMAATLGRPVQDVGHTTFRPPYSPISLGALAGPATGAHLTSTRHTPMHAWHVENGAQFVPAGLWLRPQAYPRQGESMRDAWLREAVHVRKAVGLVDVSTLGKIMVQGTDAPEFLERMYINRWKSLRVGRCRYGIMLREDGHVMDDGTTTRVDENTFYMTTTTANAGPVMVHMEYHADVVWPELDVHMTSVSDQYGAMALAGPQARAVLQGAIDGTGSRKSDASRTDAGQIDHGEVDASRVDASRVDNAGTDVSDAGLPFMGFARATIAGCDVWLFRMTFSGEMAYEVHCGANDAMNVWMALMAAGKAMDIAAYGTEAMSILRIEKGHVVGAELDGRTTPGDFGFNAMMRKDSDFVGRRALDRAALARSDRRRLVGLKPVDGRSSLPRGGHLVADAMAQAPNVTVGHITSQTFSPNLGHPIALAMLSEAELRMGSTLYAVAPLHNVTVPVEVCEPVFIDIQGARPRG
jgi:heterotetrameric sarcosine oxidase alpha subunit